MPSAIAGSESVNKISPEADTGPCVLELNANSHHFERALCNAFAIKFAEEHSDVIKIMCSASSSQLIGAAYSDCIYRIELSTTSFRNTGTFRFCRALSR